jgi:Flp pilus assembly protein TadG
MVAAIQNRAPSEKNEQVDEQIVKRFETAANKLSQPLQMDGHARCKAGREEERLRVENLERRLPTETQALQTLIILEGAMRKPITKWLPMSRGVLIHKAGLSAGECKGQGVVEFTLVVVVLLVIAWIPADFGLAFFSGQIAQNAVREAARIAAADTTLAMGTTSCTMPACMSGANILRETGVRLPAALLPRATVTVVYPTPSSSGTCNQRVKITVSGSYNFFFYQLLRLMRINAPNSVTIERSTEMRWEHQAGC